MEARSRPGAAAALVLLAWVLGQLATGQAGQSSDAQVRPDAAQAGGWCGAYSCTSWGGAGQWRPHARHPEGPHSLPEGGPTAQKAFQRAGPEGKAVGTVWCRDEGCLREGVQEVPGRHDAHRPGLRLHDEARPGSRRFGEAAGKWWPAAACASPGGGGLGLGRAHRQHRCRRRDGGAGWFPAGGFAGSLASGCQQPTHQDSRFGSAAARPLEAGLVLLMGIRMLAHRRVLRLLWFAQQSLCRPSRRLRRLRIFSISRRRVMCTQEAEVSWARLETSNPGPVDPFPSSRPPCACPPVPRRRGYGVRLNWG